MRLLSNANATPHGLHKQNIAPTPACTFCGCEDADVLHVAHHCPRFQVIRDEWSDIIHTWPFRPACAQHCPIATTILPMHTRRNWSTVQQDIARLLETWMAFRRNGALVQNITCESHAFETLRDEGARASQPEALLAAVERCAPLVQPPVACPTGSNWIDLEWKPPNSSWAFHKWGASLKDYCVLFSFWNRRTTEHYPGATICHNWTIAFLIFMQAGGNLASFVHRCPNLGAIIWKFRNLSISMFSEAWPDEPDIESLTLNRTTKFIGVLAYHLPDPFLITFSRPFNGI